MFIFLQYISIYNSYPFDLQDGLFLVTNNLSLVEGNSLAVLTPNVYEYKRLVQKVLNSEVNKDIASDELTTLCQKYENKTCATLFNASL